MDMTPDARVALYQWLADRWAETTNIVARVLHERYPPLKVYVMTAGLYSAYAYSPLLALLKLDPEHIEGVISGGYAFFEDHIKRTLLDAYTLTFWAHKAGLKAYFYHQLNRWDGDEFNNVSGAERIIRYTFRQVVADWIAGIDGIGFTTPDTILPKYYDGVHHAYFNIFDGKHPQPEIANRLHSALAFITSLIKSLPKNRDPTYEVAYIDQNIYQASTGFPGGDYEAYAAPEIIPTAIIPDEYLLVNPDILDQFKLIMLPNTHYFPRPTWISDLLDVFRRYLNTTGKYILVTFPEDYIKESLIVANDNIWHVTGSAVPVKPWLTRNASDPDGAWTITWWKDFGQFRGGFRKVDTLFISRETGEDVGIVATNGECTAYVLHFMISSTQKNEWPWAPYAFKPFRDIILNISSQAGIATYPMRREVDLGFGKLVMDLETGEFTYEIYGSNLSVSSDAAVLGATYDVSERSLTLRIDGFGNPRIRVNTQMHIVGVELGGLDWRYFTPGNNTVYPFLNESGILKIYLSSEPLDTLHLYPTRGLVTKAHLRHIGGNGPALLDVGRVLYGHSDLLDRFHVPTGWGDKLYLVERGVAGYREVYVDPGSRVLAVEANDRYGLMRVQPVIDFIHSSVSDSRTDVGSTVGVELGFKWKDGSPTSNLDISILIGSVEHTYSSDGNGVVHIQLTSPVVGEVSVSPPREVKVGGYIFAVNWLAEPPIVVFDRVIVNLSVLDDHIDVGSKAPIEIDAYYQYDGAPFTGDVILNDSLTKNASGLYKYTVSRVVDRKYGLTAFSANTVAVVFDRVIIHLDALRDRYRVGESAEINIDAHYEYRGNHSKEG